MLKHKTPSSFSGLATARAEINPTRALPVIARAWLRHCCKQVINTIQLQERQKNQSTPIDEVCVNRKSQVSKCTVMYPLQDLVDISNATGNWQQFPLDRVHYCTS